MCLHSLRLSLLKFAELSVGTSCLQCAHGCTDNDHWITLILKKTWSLFVVDIRRWIWRTMSEIRLLSRLMSSLDSARTLSVSSWTNTDITNTLLHFHHERVSLKASYACWNTFSPSVCSAAAPALASFSTRVKEKQNHKLIWKQCF